MSCANEAWQKTVHFKKHLKPQKMRHSKSSSFRRQIASLSSFFCDWTYLSGVKDFREGQDGGGGTLPVARKWGSWNENNNLKDQ